MIISYLYWKTGQGVNFGSCHPHQWNAMLKKKLKQGFKCEIEASTPELRAEQLQRIRSTPPTQGNKQ